MKSPIARGLRAASRLAEWAHRRIHGPQYAPGDVVEWRLNGMRLTLVRPWVEDDRGKDVSQKGYWIGRREDGELSTPVPVNERQCRVVRYGEGE